MNKNIIILTDGGFNSAYLLYDLTKNPDNKDAKFFCLIIGNYPKQVDCVRKQASYIKEKYPKISLRLLSLSPIPDKYIFKGNQLVQAIKTAIDSRFYGSVLDIPDIELHVYAGTDSLSHLNFKSIFEDDTGINKFITFYEPLKDTQHVQSILKLLTEARKYTEYISECNKEGTNWCNNCSACKKIKDILNSYLELPMVDSKTKYDIKSFLERERLI